MKKTRLLVLTASLIFGIGTVAYAELPDNALIVGPNAYSLDYVQTHISQLNDIINNSNSYKDIYYKNAEGKIFSLFSGRSDLAEQSIFSEDKYTNLTYYDMNGQGMGAKTNYTFADGKYSQQNSTIKTDVTKTVTSIGYFINIHVKSVSIVNPSNLYPEFFKVLDDSDTVKKIGIPDEADGEKMDDYQITLMTDKPSFTIAILANDRTEIGKVTLYNIDKQEINYVEEGSNNDKEFQLYIDSAVEESSENNGNNSGNINNNGLLANDGSWIYYSNLADGGRLYKKNETQSGDNTITLYNQRLCGDNAKFINVVGDWIYYSNYSDGQKIYKIRKDGTGRRIVCRDQASYLNVSGEYIYYAAHQENNLSNIGKLYKVRVDAQNATSGDKISDDEAEDISVDGDVVYFINVSENRKLYSIHTDGTYRHKMKSVDSSVKYATLLGSNIYYITDDGDLYRVSTADQNPAKITVRSNILDKSGNSKQVDDKIYGMNITSDNLYYWSYNGGNKLYKAPINDISSKVTGDKIGDDTVDAINVTESGDAYYTKSGKLYIANPVQSTDSSGKTTYKYSPVAVNAANPSLKLVSYDKVAYPTEDIPAGVTLDNIVNYLPDKVTATFNDSSVSEVLVNWDLENPKTEDDGTITYNGSLVGYGSKVQFKMILVSDMLTGDNVTIVNNPGTSEDTITVKNLNDGDVVNVYRTRDANGKGQELLGTSTAAAGTVTIKLTGSNVLPDKNGTVYISRTSTGKAESQPKGFTFTNADLPEALDASNIKVTNYGNPENTAVPTTDIVDVSDDSVLQEGDRIVIYRDAEKTIPIANVEVELDPDSASGPFDVPKYRALNIRLSDANSLEYDESNPNNNYIYVARNTGSAESEAVPVKFGKGLPLPINNISITDVHGPNNDKYPNDKIGNVNVNISRQSGYNYYYRVVDSISEDNTVYFGDELNNNDWHEISSNTTIVPNVSDGKYVCIVQTPEDSRLAFRSGYAQIIEGTNLISDETAPDTIDPAPEYVRGSGAHNGYTQITGLGTGTFKYRVTGSDITSTISAHDSASGWISVSIDGWIRVEPGNYITLAEVDSENKISKIDSQKIDVGQINDTGSVETFIPTFDFDDASGAENNGKIKVKIPGYDLTKRYLYKVTDAPATAPTPGSSVTVGTGSDDYKDLPDDRCISAEEGQYVNIVECVDSSSDSPQRFGSKAVEVEVVNEAPDRAHFTGTAPVSIDTNTTALNVPFTFGKGQVARAQLFVDGTQVGDSIPIDSASDDTTAIISLGDSQVENLLNRLTSGEHDMTIRLYSIPEPNEEYSDSEPVTLRVEH